MGKAVVRKGICKLCLAEKELQRSHLMPRSLYKKCMSGDPKRPHPLAGSLKGIRQTSYQVADYVFCRDCEQRISRNGEDYMMRLVATQSTFPLLDMLAASGPGISAGPVRAYAASKTALIDRDKIGYFATSVFWRASVHKWRQEDGTIVSIDLGSNNNEELRQYLIGNKEFPSTARLVAYVCSDVESQNMFWMPGENTKRKDGTCLVAARGVTFFFSMSADIPRYISNYCVMNSVERWLMVRDCSKPHKIWNFK